uniref:Uncharacterized protein n=1 Tax=Oryza punctata TaxID=4537 RepID=A0A0E0KEF5_ORYPU
MEGKATVVIAADGGDDGRGAHRVTVAMAVAARAAAVVGVNGAMASSPVPVPAAAVDCMAEALKLADCLDYVTPGNRQLTEWVYMR